MNSEESHQSVDLQENVEEILEFTMEENKVKFLIKWQNQPHSLNTWESFESVKNTSIFRWYIENLWRSYVVDIGINQEYYRKKLKHQIKDMKVKEPAVFKAIFMKGDFDEQKFKTLQLLYHFLMPDAEFERQFMDMFVLNEVHRAMSDQIEKFNHLSIHMQTIDQAVNVSFENAFDWKFPDSFKYTKHNIIINSITVVNKKSGCTCAYNCLHSKKCCMRDCPPYELEIKADRSEIVLRVPEDENQTIVECGNACKCKKGCINRYTQQNLNIRAFVIFKSKSCGWALKTGNSFFCKGSFIIECTGAFVEKSTVNHKLQKAYFFHFNHNEKEYVIDAHESGNCARFINHSCRPNAHVLKITDKSNNLTSTRLGVFALRDIEENEEITVNYDKCSVGCLNNNLKCLCGSAQCKGFIYSSKILSSASDMIEVLPPQPRIQPAVILRDVKSPVAKIHPTKNIEMFENASPILRVVSSANNENNNSDTSDTSEEESEDDHSSSEQDVPKNKAKVVSNPRKVRKGKIKCSNCSYTCSYKKGLKEHRLKYHNEGNVTICICGFIFLTSEHFNSHLKLVGNPKYQEKLKLIIEKKKKELGLKKYRWIHTKKLRAPKPDNTVHIKAYITHYTQHLKNSLELLNEIQANYFEEE